MLSPQQQIDIVKIYDDYRTNLKPLVAEIESLKQSFPTAILNEIRSCFDHIARCYSANTATEIAQNIDRACGHIKRAQLDCYKTLIVYFDDVANEFRWVNKNKDWATVDGGRFNSKFHELYSKARGAFTESKKVPDSTENWEKTCLVYRKLDKFLRDPKNVLKVDEGKNIQTWKTNLFWCTLSGIIGYFIGSIFNWFK